eukprot:356261-Chlamydomonas_euryale.AAC.1
MWHFIAGLGGAWTDPSVDGARIANGRGLLATADFSGMYRSAIRGCHEEGSAGATTFRDFLKLPGHTSLIPWPESSGGGMCLGQAGLAVHYF